MTRSAFFCSRLIRLLKKSCLKGIVNKLGILIRKLITFQNLRIRLASAQFSPTDHVISYPEIKWRCPAMRFKKNPIRGQVWDMHSKSYIFNEILTLLKICQGACRKLQGHFLSDLGHRSDHRGSRWRRFPHCGIDHFHESEIGQNFRKSALCEELAHFFRPCPGPVHPDGCLVTRDGPQRQGKRTREKES